MLSQLQSKLALEDQLEQMENLEFISKLTISISFRMNSLFSFTICTKKRHNLPNIRCSL